MTRQVDTGSRPPATADGPPPRPATVDGPTSRSRPGVAGVQRPYRVEVIREIPAGSLMTPVLTRVRPLTRLEAKAEWGRFTAEHAFDKGSVVNPATGKPYGPGPLWAGTEPMDYPDPLCICGALWGEDNRCTAVRPQGPARPAGSTLPHKPRRSTVRLVTQPSPPQTRKALPHNRSSHDHIDGRA